MAVKRASVLALLAICCATAWAAGKRHHGSGPAPAPGDFNFYFLVRQWPYTFCKTHKCCMPPDPDQGFTLHGLWPNLDNDCPSDYPELCADTNFDESEIDPAVLKAMLVEWPSYTNDPDCFYNHEWRCHGTCSNLSQDAFFNDTLTLHDQYDIAGALHNAGIDPSPQPVPTADFVKALTDAFESAPVPHCANKNGVSYISEVYQCVDRDLKVEDCSNACQHGNCDAPPGEQCHDELVYDMPHIKLFPCPSKCTIKACVAKSGTC